jgi:DinB superfamily
MARATCPLCRESHHRLGGAPVVASLAAGPRRIARAVARGRGRRLRRRPAPRAWSVVEILAHLLDAEITLGFRIRKAAAEPGRALVAWDQEKWTAGLRHRRADPRVTLAAFAALRADTVALIRRLTAAQRRAGGTHPEYGRLRIDQLLDHWAEHDLLHLEQIGSIFQALARR